MFNKKSLCYAILHLTNLGSWQKGTWLLSIHRYADQYFARFVIHAYVLGEWDVKLLSLSEPDHRPPGFPLTRLRSGLFR